jgi:NitT/TauT family transport system permease protein
MTAPLVPARRRRRFNLSLVARILVPIVTAAILIGIWAIVAATIYSDRNFLVPRPMAVLHAAIDNRSLIKTATWATFNKAITGFVLGTAIGVISAAALSQSRLLTRTLYPYAVILQTVPIIATAPIIVLQFHYGRTSIVIISMLVSIFPVFSNTLAGLASTDKNHLDLFRLHHSGRFSTLMKLRFPAAMPNIAAGLRISAGMSVIGATVGEFLVGQGGAKGGLGIAIIVSQAQLKTALLFAEAAAATLLGVVVFSMTNAISNRALRNWHESALGEGE